MSTRSTRPTALRVMAEYSSSGIWSIEPVGLFRHGMVSCASLGLPAGITARFAAWIACYDEGINGRFDSDGFNRTGLALAGELKAHMGADVSVEFVPELPDGSLGPAIRIDCAR